MSQKLQPLDMSHIFCRLNYLFERLKELIIKFCFGPPTTGTGYIGYNILSTITILYYCMF